MTENYSIRSAEAVSEAFYQWSSNTTVSAAKVAVEADYGPFSKPAESASWCVGVGSAVNHHILPKKSR